MITNRLLVVAATFEIKVGSPKSLGISTVFRTETPDPYYKGKAIWGVGKYFSLTKEESERVAGEGEIKEYPLPNTLKLMDFDLTWRKDPARSDFDYEKLHSLIGKAPPGIDGFVIRSNSMQYGYSQVVIFPKAIPKLGSKLLEKKAKGTTMRKTK